MSTYANVYQRTDEEREQDIKMMSDPMAWPMLYLPVKRLTNEPRPECALMIGDGPRVYLANLYDERLKQKDSQIQHLDYESYETLFDDGWVVD